MTTTTLGDGFLTFKNSGTDYGTLTGGATDGLITFSSNAGNVRLSGVSDPSSAQDVATKAYVDALPGTTPGGSNTQIQYNNSSIFGGISQWTTNGTTTFTGSGTSILNILDNGQLNIGTGNDLSLTHTGIDSIITSTTGNLIIDNTLATGFTIMRLGTITSATGFQVQDSSGGSILSANGDGQVQVRGGTSANPTYTFNGGLNTGIYRPSANTIGISTGGSLSSSISSTAITNAVPILGQSGSALAPSYSFSGDPNTGIYNSVADTLDFTTGGTNRLSISTTDITTTIPLTVAGNSISSVTGSGTQSISTSTLTTLTSTYWDGTATSTGDNGNFPTFSAGIWTINKAGIYAVSYQTIIGSGPSGAGFVQTFISLNNSTTTGIYGNSLVRVYTTLIGTNGSAIINLNVSDNLRIYILQDDIAKNMSSTDTGRFELYRIA